jgi:hypothetical protein
MGWRLVVLFFGGYVVGQILYVLTRPRNAQAATLPFVPALGSVYPIVTVDPGVNTAHSVGTLPCPGNPPPPSGWVYWTGAVPPNLAAWAVHVLHTYPIGSIVQDLVDGELAMARVEWHTARGATGETGLCIHGVNLFRRVGAA